MRYSMAWRAETELEFSKDVESSIYRSKEELVAKNKCVSSENIRSWIG